MTLNLHQERCKNHKSRYIVSRFLTLRFGQVYSSNTLVTTESYEGGNIYTGRNGRRFHSNSHCGLLKLRMAENKMGEGISNYPTGLSV